MMIWRGASARAFILGALLVSGCASGAPPVAPTPKPTAPAVVTAAASAHVYPGASWERIDRPESVGWSAAGLEQVRAELAKLPSTGFMAIVGGRVLFEYGDVAAVSYLASVRKSILSMLFGNYVASGKVRLDKTLAEMGIDDLGGLTADEKRATVRDLLMARSGIYHPASNSGDDSASAPPRGSQKPGSYYLYNNWDFNAVGTAFEKETGRDLYDALESDLAKPIGMQDFDRGTHKKSGDLSRSMHPAYHMNLSTRDMARIGYLMLREGNWAGRQLVPRDWVRESTRAATPVSEMNPARRRDGPFGYGYLWWVWDGPHAKGPYAGAYTGLGAVGQHITIVPALDLVVVHKTRPGQPRSVSHPEYQRVLDTLINARVRTESSRPASETSGMRLVILGTGTPNADPERSGPALAVVAGDQSYLIDAGPGVVRRAAAANAKGMTALRPAALNRVFISHLHSDHTLGLPDLMFSPWVLERATPLAVYGPEGIVEMTKHIEEAWREDIYNRLFGLEPQSTRNYRAVTSVLKPGQIYKDNAVQVDAIPVMHGSWPEAFGFRFRSADRTIVISGDARPSPSLIDACNGCDVLVHEVYSAVRFKTRPPEWQKYHADAHTSTIELAAIAAKAKPKLLVLYHQLFWGATDADLVREMREAGYRGEVVSAKDLDVF